MSLFPLEELRIAFGPDRIDLVRLKRGWRGLAVTHRESAACEPAAATQPPWHAAIETLSAVLGAAGGAAASTRVVLSDDFVRYLLIPWRTDLRDAGEIEALARIRFRDIHGPAADDWSIRLSATQFGAAYVACALDHELLRALTHTHELHKQRLASVRPLLISTFNGWRGRKTAGNCWFAVCESRRLTLCRVEGGAWRAIRGQKFEDDPAGELRVAVERESLSLGIDPEGASIYVFAPEQPRLVSGPHSGVSVSVLEPRYAMALS